MHGHSRSIRFTGCTLLALLLAAATLPSPAQATTTTWKVRANTTLTDNFFGTIEIVKDGVTLDCDSYKVTGDGHGRGIVVDKRTGVTIRNCDVSNFATGIWVAGTTDSVFERNKSHNNLNGEGNGFVNGYGFWVQSSSRNEFRDNEMFDNDNDGLGARSSSANLFTGNESSRNAAGFWMTGGSDGNTFEGNTAEGNRAWGFSLFKSSDNTLSYNHSIDSAWDGFNISGGATHPAVGNRLQFNTATGSGGAGFFVGENAADNALVEDEATTNRIGFAAVNGATSNTFQENSGSLNSFLDGYQDAASTGNFWIDNCFGTFYGIPDQTACSNDAMVRVLHASPDAPAVDVYVNGDKVGDPLAGLEFGDLSAYVKLPAGTYDLKVCAAADATVCPIVADGVALAAGTHYTIAATNVLASIEAKIITDTPSPKAGKTQVRVVHFSADTPAVDVLTQDGSAKVVENLSYPDKTDYLTLAPGSYDLKVCATADNTVCPLDPGPLALEAATSYSVFAIGSLEGETLTAAVGVDGVADRSQ